MAVLDPLKVVLVNYPEGQTEELDVVNNPEDPGAGTRKVTFARELFGEGRERRRGRGISLSGLGTSASTEMARPGSLSTTEPSLCETPGRRSRRRRRQAAEDLVAYRQLGLVASLPDPVQGTSHPAAAAVEDV